MSTLFEISLCVRSYYDIQKLRVAHGNRLAALERGGKIPPGAAERLFEVEHRYLQQAESSIGKKIDKATREHLTRVEFMDRVKGIGPILSGALIAIIGTRQQVHVPCKLALLETETGPQWFAHPSLYPLYLQSSNGKTVTKKEWSSVIAGHGVVSAKIKSEKIERRWVTHPDLFPNDGVRTERWAELGVERDDRDGERHGIACFGTVSKLWAFAGLHVVDGKAPRRKSGVRCNWNTTLQVIAWKIGESFVRCGGAYRKAFDAKKIEIRKRLPDESDSHTHRMAKRWTVKLFFSHLWEVWRRQENLPVRPPYVIEHVDGHEEMFDPWSFVEPLKKRAS